MTLNTEFPIRLQIAADRPGEEKLTLEPPLAREDKPAEVERQGDRKENESYRAMVERWWKIFS
jgi:hypothetical protein